METHREGKEKKKVYDHDSPRGLATVVVVVQYDAKGYDNLNNKKKKKKKELILKKISNPVLWLQSTCYMNLKS